MFKVPVIMPLWLYLMLALLIVVVLLFLSDSVGGSMRLRVDMSYYYNVDAVVVCCESS